MSKIDLSQISDKQYAFLSAKPKHVGFGGARGGGKSWSVRTKAKILAAVYPGIKQLIVRRTYPELVNNHINTLINELYGIARYNKSEKMFTFPNGSTIKFGYCNADKDLDQYQGAEYDIIFLDEATQLQEMWIKKITACLRGVNNFPKRIYYTCNPGGVSHGYFKRLFIDRKYEEGENPEDYCFIQALVTDNKALMKSQPDYIKQLEALPPKLRDAWLYGRWDVYEGQFFETFRTEPDRVKCHEAGISLEQAKTEGRWTHVIKPLDLNAGNRRGWKIYRSYDFGYAKPFSCAWWAIDYDGTLYRIRELYGCTGVPDQGVRWTVEEQMEKIRQIEDSDPWLRGHSVIGVADPAIWDGSRGKSIAQTAAEFGLHFVPGIHQRIPGWMQLRRRLQFDREGKAGLYVFSGCKDFIRTLSALRFDPQRPEDLDTRGEDHIADETRYLCMLVPLEAKPLPQEEKIVIFGGKE